MEQWVKYNYPFQETTQPVQLRPSTWTATTQTGIARYKDPYSIEEADQRALR
jgi:hypothetical protein